MPTTASKRTVPEVIALRLPPDIRTRLQRACDNLTHFSRHAIALTALSAGLDSSPQIQALAANGKRRKGAAA